MASWWKPNDYAAVHLLSRQQQAFAGGAALNIYNANSLQILRDRGMVRWQPPLETSRDIIRNILSATPQPFSTELFAWGYMTLAYSARCYTARAHGLAKDDCRFICLEHPAGMQVNSQDGSEVFTLNGIQTQSGRCVFLLNEWQEAATVGITHMRLSADGEHVLPRITQLKNAIEAGQSRVGEAGPGACNGYWNQIAGMQMRDA
jgi:collagenase-like PrtC family protease